jgi:hypothetical protein
MIFQRKEKGAQERADAAESWSGYATLLILAGIVAEIGLLFVFPHDVSSVERWSLVGSNAAIGIGLTIEFICILAAIKANRDLKIESDAKLAEATQQAAQAYSQAAGSMAMAAEAKNRALRLQKEIAEANARASEAQLALEKYKAPRHLDSKQWEHIAAKLKSFGPQVFDMAVNTHDPEAIKLGNAIECHLRSLAGWTEINWAGGMIVFERTQLPTWGVVTIEGVLLVVHDENVSAIPVIKALAELLTEAGINGARAEVGVGGKNDSPTAIHILVGEKI